MKKPPSKNVYREVGADDIRAFSSFKDLLQARIEAKEVNSEEDLLKRRPDLLGGMLFEWYRQGQIACVFAQRLARQPQKALWQSVTVTGDIDVTAIDPLVEQAAGSLEGLQLIFPGRSTAGAAVEILTNLSKSSNWSVNELDWMPDEKGRSLQIGLRWQPASRQYNSWVLGIAPFDSMPFTRRFEGAPFIALVLRPSPPTEYAPTPVDEHGIPASHLAHMNDGLGEDQVKRERSTEITRRAKVALLGTGLRSEARAKVTFSLPIWCRTQLVEHGVLPPLEH